MLLKRIQLQCYFNPILHMALILGVLLSLKIYFIEIVYAMETTITPPLTKEQQLLLDQRAMRQYTREHLQKYPEWSLVSKKEFAELLERYPEYKPKLQHLLKK